MVPAIRRATVAAMQQTDRTGTTRSLAITSTRTERGEIATRLTPLEGEQGRLVGTPARATRLATKASALLIALALLGVLGCDRNIEPYQPGEEPSAPDLARIFPGPPPSAQTPGAAGAADGTPDRTALPPSRAEGSEVASASAAPITGTINLAPALAGTAPSDAVLFVIARPQGARGGPPLAVLRIPSPSFPLPFSIGPENVMIPSMRFEGNISLSARLDADGNAMTRGAGDISSSTLEPLSPGTADVTLVLSDAS